MKSKQHFIFFAIALYVVNFCVFAFLPIRIFPAEVISNSVNAITDISIGDWLGFSSADYNFKLLGKGYALVLLMIIGLPTLIAYSFWIKTKTKNDEH